VGRKQNCATALRPAPSVDIPNIIDLSSVAEAGNQRLNILGTSSFRSGRGRNLADRHRAVSDQIKKFRGGYPHTLVLALAWRQASSME